MTLVHDLKGWIQLENLDSDQVLTLTIIWITNKE